MSLLVALLLVPAVAGVVSYFVRSNRLRRLLWGAVAAFHFSASVVVSLPAPPAVFDGWIGVDSLSAVFLVLTSLLFLAVTVHGIGYVHREPVTPRRDPEGGRLQINEPESIFTGSLLLLLATMSLAVVSRHFALQWVAIEATTLASAPLVYYHRSRRSLEAAWKYVILCSVGIGLALLGLFFIRMTVPGGLDVLTVDALLRQAGEVNHKWLGTAFLFLLVGYGTKMGLAPLHAWLPDAHSEAPAPVSALLSGALLNCAFLGILRVQQVAAAAGMAAFGGDLLIVFGLLSMGLAGVFILRQTDYKRMLAYSSVEHMGILALGVGLGGLGAFGSLLHAVNHSLVKAMLFLTAGNILARFHTKDTLKVQGLCRVLPVSGVLWIAGFLAITGSPPFGTFVSEFTILKAILDRQRWVVAALYAGFLLLVFVAMSIIVLRMALGRSEERPQREPITAVLGPVALAVLAILLGVHLPHALVEKLHAAAQLFGGPGQ